MAAVEFDERAMMKHLYIYVHIHIYIRTYVYDFASCNIIIMAVIINLNFVKCQDSISFRSVFIYSYVAYFKITFSNLVADLACGICLYNYDVHYTYVCMYVCNK